MCLTFYSPMDCSTSGFAVLHYLPEFAQTHDHWVNDAIQPSLSLPSPLAFNLSQHQGLFKWVSSSHQVANVLELQLQHQSFRRVNGVDFIWGWLVLISLAPKGLSRVFCSTTVQKHHFFSTLPSLLSAQLLPVYMTTGKTIALTIQTSVGKVMFLLLTRCLGLSQLSCQEAIIF